MVKMIHELSGAKIMPISMRVKVDTNVFKWPGEDSGRTIGDGRKRLYTNVEIVEGEK